MLKYVKNVLAKIKRLLGFKKTLVCNLSCYVSINIEDYKELKEGTVLVGVPKKAGTGVEYVVLYGIGECLGGLPVDYHVNVTGKNGSTWSKKMCGVESVQEYTWREEKVPDYDKWYEYTVTPRTKDSISTVRLLTGSIGRDAKVRLLYDIYDRPREEEFNKVLEDRLATYSAADLVKWYLDKELGSSAKVKEVKLEGAYMTIKFESVSNEQHVKLMIKHIKGVGRLKFEGV